MEIDRTGELSKAAATIVALWLIAAMAGRIVDVRLSIASVAIAGAALCVWRLPALFRRLGTPSTGKIAMGLAAAAVMTAATYFLYPILTRIDPGIADAASRLYALLHVPHATIPILIMVDCIVVGEEILWRGMVQEWTQSRWRPPVAILVSAIVYGLAHAPIGSPLLVLVAIACGAYWSTLRWASRSLWPSLLAHIVWDMSIILHPLAKAGAT